MTLPATYIEQSTRRPDTLQTPVVIPVTPLQTTNTTLITVNDSSDFWIVNLWVSNVTGSAATYSVYSVPSGGSAATGNAIAETFSIPARTADTVGVNYRLAPGGTLVASCSVNSAVNIGGWGYLQTGAI